MVGILPRVVITVRTERLVLRRVSADVDVDNFVDLDSDPEVMRYLSGGAPTPREEVEREIMPALIAEYERTPGFGLWAAEVDGEYVGWFCLRIRRNRPAGDAELGYRLKRAVWRRGLATEGSRALIARAFGELGVARVYAETMAGNVGSRAVMAKVGLRFVRSFHEKFDWPVPGTEHAGVEYAITRAEYEALQG